MKNIIFFIVIALFFSLTNCTDVIDLELPDGDVQLVVDGLLTNQVGEKQVLLTSTTNYFENKEAPAVSGALVLLYNETGLVDTLKEKKAGTYVTQHVGKVGATYHLYIRTKAGEEYESKPEFLRAVSEIDSIYYEYKEKTAFQDAGYYVKINTSEPLGVGDYYRWKQYINGEYKNKPLDLLYATDEFVDGNPIIGFEVSLNPLEKGDQFRIQQMSISKGEYDFLTQLTQQTANVGSLFDSPPAALPGNIVGVKNTKKQALGFFSASAVAESEVFIKE